jgi:hypothetical protein
MQYRATMNFSPVLLLKEATQMLAQIDNIRRRQKVEVVDYYRVYECIPVMVKI